MNCAHCSMEIAGRPIIMVEGVNVWHFCGQGCFEVFCLNMPEEIEEINSHVEGGEWPCPF